MGPPVEDELEVDSSEVVVSPPVPPRVVEELVPSLVELASPELLDTPGLGPSGTQALAMSAGAYLV